MGKRIIFTGGSGKIGRHVIPHLLEHGHQVLNLDLTPLDVWQSAVPDPLRTQHASLTAN